MIDLSSYDTYTGKSSPPQPRARQVAGPSTAGQQLQYQRERDERQELRQNERDSLSIANLQIDDFEVAKLQDSAKILKSMGDYNVLVKEMLMSSPDKTLSPEQQNFLKGKRSEIYTQYNTSVTSQQNYLKTMADAEKKFATLDKKTLDEAVRLYMEGKAPFLLTSAPELPENIYSAINKVRDSILPSTTSFENVTIKSGDVTKIGRARIDVNNDPDAENKIKELIKGSIVYNNRARADVENRFSSLPVEEQQQFLEDTNNDNKLDASDIDDNALLRWAYQDPLMRQAAIGFDEYAPSKVTPKAPKEEAPAKKRPSPINYGGITRNNLYSFGGVAVKDVPTAGGTILLDNRTSPITKGTTPGGSNVSGDLLDYDKDSDKVVIRVSTGVPDLRIDSKALIEVPADNIPGINDKKVMYDGKLTTIGELRGKTQAPAPKKKVYNPATGKIEEVDNFVLKPSANAGAR